MRILHLITHLSPGGIERWLLGILPYLRAAGIEVDFLCRASDKGSLAAQAEAQGARFFTNPTCRNQLTFRSLLQERLRTGEYALVHNHLTLHSGLPALTCRRMNIPNIVSFHNSYFAPLEIGAPWQRTLHRFYAKISLRLAVRHADRLTFCSEDVQTGVRRWVDFGRTPTEVLPYGVEIPRAATAEERIAFRQELGLPAEAVLITHVGRFSEQKNHTALLKIAKRVCAERQDAAFICVGDGPLRAAIQAEAAALGLAERVLFSGLRDDVERILACSDVFLFPSLWEGLPVAALEAGAAGLPIVGADVAGVRLAVVDGVTGYLQALSDVSGFAEKVGILTGNENLRARLGLAARKRVEQHFSYRASAEQLVALYRQLIRSN